MFLSIKTLFTLDATPIGISTLSILKTFLYACTENILILIQRTWVWGSPTVKPVYFNPSERKLNIKNLTRLDQIPNKELQIKINPLKTSEQFTFKTHGQINLLSKLFLLSAGFSSVVHNPLIDKIYSWKIFLLFCKHWAFLEFSPSILSKL